MASFSDLAGIIVIRDRGGRHLQRVRSEIRRIGPFRFLDVIGYKIYCRLFLTRKAREWQENKLAQLCREYPEVPAETDLLLTSDPNSDRTRDFMEERRPDIVFARCKSLLKERIFSIPDSGVFVAHPGICPEYRNSHGCFWALASGDLEKVGMTLLKIDKGIDTGPVHEYFTCDYDEVKDSHIIIQDMMTFENLDGIRIKFEEIVRGNCRTIDTSGRSSRVWGQPWLSKYLGWKRQARRRGK